MKKSALMVALSVIFLTSANAQQQTTLAAKFDKVIKEELLIKETGATVLVSSRGKIIYEKALGIANVELNVPMQVDNVFRIASITKQFTAMAILQLMERGKLSLQDEITRYIPDYSMQGSKITIENLLTHTSGILDYTTIKDTTQRFRMDVTPLELINLFKDQPMRFAPGAKYEYSNSNYVLLGYIIEKLSGQTYGQYLDDNIFKPLGMTNSYYGNDKKVIKNRVAGYSVGEKQLENATAISMTRPYAAGAILSTVEDLFKWNQAVQACKLVKKETLQKALTRYKLTNGKDINYGYGVRFGFIQQSPSIWHGGLIDGFMSMAMYLPKEDVYVVVLSNCNNVSPERVTAKLAAVAIGKPFEYKEIAVDNSVLQSYAGTYQNESGDQVTINAADGKLTLQRGNGPKVNVKAFENDNFFFPDGLMTMRISVATNSLTIQTRNGNEVWTRSENKITGQTEIKVDEKILEMYTGEYEVTPQFTFSVTREKDRLFLQAVGQEKFELFAESNNKFFLKVNDARLEFVSESGKITKAILKQGGRTADAMKTK